MRLPDENRSIALGTLFQLPMIGIYLTIIYLYEPLVKVSPWIWLSHAGFVLFCYCLVHLYVMRKRDNQLIVTGPFRYTRHPMYTGIMLMNLQFWLPFPVSFAPSFIFIQLAFVGCLIMAAYFQEKETVARFGKIAEEYYERTPRLFFLYPLIRTG